MRATQYLSTHGSSKFFQWFDHESWYPLGRPVGTTIFPGMQFTAVFISKLLVFMNPYWERYFSISVQMSLNDICCYIPIWFAAVASISVGLLTIEISGSHFAGGVASAIMAIVPAHLMRSIGGSFDNESVAVPVMCLCFYLWCRSLRTKDSWKYSPLAGLAYGYMVSTWGGFVFVGNLIALHALFLLLTGYYSYSLYLTYSIWYIIGTICAIQIPVVGLSPFKSLDQISMLIVFLTLQLICLSEWLGKKRKLQWTFEKDQWINFLALRITVILIAFFLVALPLLCYLIPTGYFGPLSIRIRSLFIRHTRTGNPLVDSVAEHQPLSQRVSLMYLLQTTSLSSLGFWLSFFIGAFEPKRSYSGIQVTKWFIILYSIVTSYFAHRMSRLILLQAPVASILSGIAIDFLLRWSMRSFQSILDVDPPSTSSSSSPSSLSVNQSSPSPSEKPNLSTRPSDSIPSDKDSEPSKKKPSSQLLSNQSASKSPSSPLNPSESQLTCTSDHLCSLYGLDELIPLYDWIDSNFRTSLFLKICCVFVGWFIMTWLYSNSKLFWRTCDLHAKQISNPQVMFLHRPSSSIDLPLIDPSPVIIRDYYDSYIWLKENTPSDSRVLAWWDYGYQITGIGNRTTIADGNTWNTEHIALVGRVLMSPEREAHNIARHLADYVLIWAGSRNDDLAKSPHILRIANSVHPHICGPPESPTQAPCKQFQFIRTDQGFLPSPSMTETLLYKLHRHNLHQSSTNNTQESNPHNRIDFGTDLSIDPSLPIEIDPTMFREVHTSLHGLVRIFQVLNISTRSKDWNADPQNRLCDAPGSWFCPGSYSPELKEILSGDTEIVDSIV